MNTEEMIKLFEKRVEMINRKSEAIEKNTSIENTHSEKNIIINGYSLNTILEALQNNEDGDAMLFTTIHRNTLCYDHANDEWYIWDGHHWRLDDIEHVISAIQKIIDIYVETTRYKANQKIEALTSNRLEEAKEHQRIEQELFQRISKLQNVKRKLDVIRLARVGHNLGISGKEWDVKPNLLGCKNGVIDLESGNFRDGLPNDYIKTASPIEWKGINEPCPTWEKFLQEVFLEDIELIQYVHRLLGYAITGNPVEHILPILWGKGRNGKGTLLETIHYVLGELSGPLPSETLLEQDRKQSGSSPTSDIMSLKGKRVVWACETDEGRRLNASKIKWLCGGDTLVGRAPFQKRQVSFKATHVLFLLTNHRPHIQADDFAAWQRIHLIPFTVTFVDNPVANFERQRDPMLLAKLQLEASGILAWLVRGALSWKQNGLHPPQTVVKATDEYRNEEDIIGHCIHDVCITDRYSEVRAGELYKAYTIWCRENGHKPISGTRFGKGIKEKYQCVNTMIGISYKGLKLKSDWKTKVDNG